MVFLKKWEIGGNIDTIWYAAISKNVALSGEYFRFWISKFPSVGNNVADVRDHMPMTYWVVGTFMKIFGVSDFVAKLYPLFCSFFTNILIYKFGSYLKDKFFGITCLISVALIHQYMKWQGQLKMEIPLTIFIMGIIFLLFRYLREKDNKFLYFCAPLFFLGIMTKGPIIFCIPLALFFWTLIYRDFTFLKSPHLYGATGLLLIFCSLMFIPSLYFDGQNVFSWFYQAKKSFGEPHFDLIPHLKRLVISGPLHIIFLIPGYQIAKKMGLKKETGLFILMVLCILIPLSFFKIKLDHYLFPSYPFLAFAAAPVFYQFLKRWENKTPDFLIRLSLVVVLVMVAFPLKTSGRRTKENINIPLILKFDKKIKEKNVWFYGTWDDDMEIFQNYQLYGDIDLRSITNLNAFNLGNDYLVVNKTKLPVSIGGIKLSENDCYLEVEKKCVFSGETRPKFKLPPKKLFHEVYLVD
jgi:4-amino-4-deoxy-L-arabinose transferase-like glycosyltransferase